MNLISNEKIIDNDGKEITGSDGKTLFASPPLVMVKLTFNSVLSRNESSSFGPFTMDCRLKDNLAEYHFDNLRDFRGRTAVFFDFVPRFS
ncbi:unnamed protein product [Thelazia callipaeda]|uniref:Uncharacterized protein n=1 Tax=Thelazia callipaeda TaxID=103827 RepID=A0A0N5CR79_THECL|nr:unnamed protein product [Thelazia callipaeda]